MKKHFSVYMLGMLALAITAISSCKKEEDSDGKPKACINASSTATVGSSVSFTNCSTDGLTYLWDFGVAGSATDVATTQNASFTYTTAGTYTVTLTATNAKGSTSTTKTVTVTTGGGGAITAADYAGTYAVAAGSCAGAAAYNIVVTVSGNTVTVNNFANYGSQASVSGTATGGSLALPQQNVNPTPAFITATTGTLSANKQTLTIPYTVNDGGGGGAVTCTIVATRQ